jgi:transposase
MAFNLSESNIRQRLVEWRNLKRLHAEQKRRNQKLEAELRELKIRYERDLAKRDQLIEKLMLRIGDLEKMIFGSKRNRDRGSNSSPSSSGQNDSQKEPKKRRPKDSYQRSQPQDEDVTTTKHHPVTACRHCGGQLSRFEEVVRYVEDIILPQLIGKLTKTITKHIIERGYCANCGVWSAAKDLRGQAVSLGQNVKLLVTYLVTILDCSYEQVKTLTNDLYGLTLSDGEIVNILKATAHSWLPEYQRLLKLIRAGPGAHFDETTWPIQIFAKHCYGWVMSAVNSPVRIYKLAHSRGKDHATELLGDVSPTFVRITDCYSAYQYITGLHQICWAHLYRQIRDLLNNKNLAVDKWPYIKAWYGEFSAVYADLRAALEKPFNKRERYNQEQDLRQRIETLCQPHQLDPKPLADLKALMIKYDHALFTCLKFKGIPCDNNRAERDIRSLVIKRKKSFGSRTEAGAHALGILLSVAWSTWYMNRNNFLPALVAIGEREEKV